MKLYDVFHLKGDNHDDVWGQHMRPPKAAAFKLRRSYTVHENNRKHTYICYKIYDKKMMHILQAKHMFVYRSVKVKMKKMTGRKTKGGMLDVTGNRTY